MTSAPENGPRRRNPARRPDGSRRPWLVLTVAATVMGVVTLVGGRGRAGPRVTDEIGYLLNARVLAGGPTGDLSCCSVYSGGYSLLLAPVALLWERPEAFYRGALVLNAVLVALVVPCGYALVRRVVRCGPVTATVAGVVAAAVPGLQVNARYAWSEALLCLLVVGWLGCWARATGDGPPGGRVDWALPASSLVAAAMVTTHNRMFPVLVLQTGALLVLAVSRRRGRGALLSFALLAVVGAAGVALNAWLADENWPTRGGNAFLANVGVTLRSPDAVERVATFAAGQLAYLAVATAGLAVCGILLGLRSAFVGRPCERFVGLLLAGLTAGIALLVGLIAAAVGDPSYWAYGRYVEVVAPAAVCLAVAACLHRPVRGAVTLAVSAGVGILLLLPVRDLASGPTVSPLNVSGLVVTWAQPLTMDAARSGRVAAAAALVVAALLAARAVATRSSSPRLAVLAASAVVTTVLALFAASVGAFTSQVQRPDQRTRYPGGLTASDAPLPAAGPVGVVIPDGGDGHWSMLLFFLPGRAVEVDVATLDGTRGPRPGVVLLPADGRPGPSGWTETGQTPDGLWQIWRRPAA